MISSKYTERKVESEYDSLQFQAKWVFYVLSLSGGK